MPLKIPLLFFFFRHGGRGLFLEGRSGLRACNAISPSADEKSRAAELELVAVAAMMITMFHLSGWGAPHTHQNASSPCLGDLRGDITHLQDDITLTSPPPGVSLNAKTQSLSIHASGPGESERESKRERTWGVMMGFVGSSQIGPAVICPTGRFLI